jgi:hypothetical protein
MKQFFLFFFFVLVLFGSAQPPSKFHCRYGGSGYDVGYDVKQTLDKGYIITGSTSSFGQGNTDIYLLKLDSMGQVKFQTSFGGYSNDIGKSILVLPDSGFVIVGYTSSMGIGGYDILMVKADKNGALQWQKTFGGTDWDFAHCIKKTSDGGFIIGGTTYSFGYGNADGYVIKTDANGIVEWSKTYGGKKDDEFKSVIETNDGNYALAGYTKSYADSLGDAWVFKIAANGDSIWSNYYGNKRNDYVNDLVQDNQGDYYVAGAIDSLKAGYLDAYAFKLNSSGMLLWRWVDGFVNTNDSYNSVVLSKKTPGNSIYSQTETFPGFGIHIKIMELNSGGNYFYATEYGGILADEIFQLDNTNNKGYVGVGYTNNYNAKLTDVYVLKLDTNLVGSSSIVSIDEIADEEIQLKVYPNPTSKEINIICSVPVKNENVSLFNLFGEEINCHNRILSSDNKSKKMNVEGLKNGIYYLRILNRTEKISIYN